MAAVNVTFPGNLAQVKSANDLRSVPTALIPSGALFLVNGLEGLFEFNAGLLEADDGKDIIRPYDRTPGQAGRWVRNVDGLATGPVGETGPANNTYSSYAALQASDPTRKYAYLSGDTDTPAHPDGPYSNTTGVVGQWQPQTAAGIRYLAKEANAVPRDLLAKGRDAVSLQDFGAAGDGVTDDTAAWNKAVAVASVQGRQIDARGTFAIANGNLPGTNVVGVNKYLEVLGNPTFVQAIANAPILRTDPNVLQQGVGYRMACTIVPHPNSDKSNPANIGLDLTGMSGSEIWVQLGQASSYSATKGRFHDAVFAAASSPFHYGVHVHYIASQVPAPLNGVTYGNRGTGSLGNPNINKVSCYVNALDTVAGDTILNLGDSTLVEVAGPSLLEACPNATGIRFGNATRVTGAVWVELVTGAAFDFLGTASTTPNNCKLDHIYLSGGGHVIKIRNDLGAPPQLDVIGIGNATFVDQNGTAYKPGLITKSYPAPSPVAISFVIGGPTQTFTDTVEMRFPQDHHGRAAYHHRYQMDSPTGGGRAVLRLVPPAGYEIEGAAGVSIENAGNAPPLTVGLSNATNGNDYSFWWPSTSARHFVNIRYVLRATT